MLALDLNHTVDQEERKSVGQNVENINDVQRGLCRRRGCGRWVSGVGHFLSSGSCCQEAKIILYRDSAAECGMLREYGSGLVCILSLVQGVMLSLRSILREAQVRPIHHGADPRQILRD